MPNRMLRDWTKSEKVDALSVYAERFFTRLIMKVDDYGCYYADTRVLKADLFTLKLDEVSDSQIAEWIRECEQADLIVLYKANNKFYLQIQDFRQRLDKAKAKFPLPTSGEPLTTSRPEEEEKKNLEEKREQIRGRAPELSDSNLYRQPSIPTIEEVKEQFIRRGGTEEMAEKFFLKHNSVGWFLNNSPIKNFASLIPGYIHNWQQNDSKGQRPKKGAVVN
jgi:hypothetical protein